MGRIPSAVMHVPVPVGNGSSTGQVRPGVDIGPDCNVWGCPARSRSLGHPLIPMHGVRHDASSPSRDDPCRVRYGPRYLPAILPVGRPMHSMTVRGPVIHQSQRASDGDPERQEHVDVPEGVVCDHAQCKRNQGQPSGEVYVGIHISHSIRTAPGTKRAPE
jgi:hypothetical protein